MRCGSASWRFSACPSGLLIGRLLPLLEHVVRKRGIAMTTSIPETLPDVAGDPGRLQQVFINLLMNAVEATPRRWADHDQGVAMPE